MNVRWDIDGVEQNCIGITSEETGFSLKKMWVIADSNR